MSIFEDEAINRKVRRRSQKWRISKALTSTGVISETQAVSTQPPSSPTCWRRRQMPFLRRQRLPGDAGRLLRPHSGYATGPPARRRGSLLPLTLRCIPPPKDDRCSAPRPVTVTGIAAKYCRRHDIVLDDRGTDPIVSRRAEVVLGRPGTDAAPGRQGLPTMNPARATV